MGRPEQVLNDTMPTEAGMGARRSDNSPGAWAAPWTHCSIRRLRVLGLWGKPEKLRC